MLSCLAGTLLDIGSEEARELFAWLTIAASVLAAFFFPRRLAAGWVVATLTVQEWLSRGAGLAEGKIAGVNASTLITFAAMAAYAYRFRRSRLSPLPGGALRPLVAAYVVVDLMVTLRGFQFEAAQMAQLISGYARLACVYLWTRRLAAAENPSVLTGAVLVLVAGPALVGYSTYAAVAGTAIADYEDLARARTSGIFDPNLTMTGVGLAVLLAAFALAARNRSRWGLASLAVAAAGLTAIVYSGSRTALAALLLGLGVALVSSRGQRMGLAIAAVLVSGVIIWASLPDALKERFADARGGYSETRIPVLMNAYDAFLENPVFGSGRDVYRFRQRATTTQVAHNTLLNMLAEGGILQAGLYLAAMGAMIAQGLRYRRRPGREFGVLAIALTTLLVVAGNGLSFVLGDYCSTFYVVSVTFALTLAEHQTRLMGRSAELTVDGGESLSAVQRG